MSITPGGAAPRARKSIRERQCERQKDEGRRMKEQSPHRGPCTAILCPSAFILLPSAFCLRFRGAVVVAHPGKDHEPAPRFSWDASGVTASPPENCRAFRSPATSRASPASHRPLRGRFAGLPGPRQPPGPPRHPPPPPPRPLPPHHPHHPPPLRVRRLGGGDEELAVEGPRRARPAVLVPRLGRDGLADELF